MLNIVAGGNELGQAMTEHADIGKISFTGSTATGRRIMQSASGNLKRITLELGGNDPAIVLPDVNTDTIAKDLFWAAFQNSASSASRPSACTSTTASMTRSAASWSTTAQTVKVGDGSQQGTDLGPIQNKMQYEKLRNLLDDARKSGVRFLLGGTIEPGQGYYVPVTIVDNPPDDSRVVVEEAFGPVLPLLRYTDIDEVVRRANDTEYGLAASVWGSDEKAARSVADRLQCGTVWINEVHTFSPHVAFGGHKQSGIGIENALDGVLEYTSVQTIATKHSTTGHSA